MTKPSKPKPGNKKSTEFAAKGAKSLTKRLQRLKDEKGATDLKSVEAAKAKAATQAKALAFFSAKTQTSATPKDSIMASPRNPQTKRTDVSTPTSKSDTSVASQGNKQKLRIDGPPTLTNTSKASEFDEATKDLVPAHGLTHPDCPYTNDDCFKNGEHNCLITDDSLFVMETAGLDLSKDPRSKEVILQIFSEKNTGAKNAPDRKN